ncbi:MULTISPECIES: calcium-binding protein [Calothrix]|uniref:Calcium-binding protein n=2 Tax=Calothrix TaxID=1186 RepID=A0ABR8AEY1_9CYAN|nr:MULTISPECIES: hypothetical protein [Calothrix]MBD2198045.1 hypothetical protein [Calothrix parietina FACHB-288]MBD2226322.1 hypothetical protein [Calothrix anomala FACHB-343]
MTTRIFRGTNYTVESLRGSDQTFKTKQKNTWLEIIGTNNIISTGKGNDVILANLRFTGIGNYPPYVGPAIFYDGYDGILESSKRGTTIIDTGSGNDYVALGEGKYIVDLGQGNNILDSGGTSSYISAGNGNNIIQVLTVDNCQINLGNGNNSIYLGTGNVSVSTGSGNDLITINIDGLFGILGDVLFDEAVPYKQIINAGNGDNLLKVAVYGETSITTGSGKDFVLATSANTQILDKEPNLDSVDILTGSGNDTVITLGTKSFINAGTGDDLIFSGIGDDTIYTGSGRDVVNLRRQTFFAPSPIQDLEEIYASETTVQGGGNDTVYLGSGHKTVILGSSGFATIYGFGKNDSLDVSGLNASFTQIGNDTLISSGGNSLGIIKEYTGSLTLV